MSGNDVKVLYRFGAIVSHMKLFENASANIPFKVEISDKYVYKCFLSLPLN